MRARLVLATALVTALAIGALSGCSKKITPVGNTPPETYLFVQGPIDTVNHRVHLFWYGTDPDGAVAAYAIRWVYPEPAPQDVEWDTVRVAGNPAPRDSMFTMFTGDSATVMPRFEVFAIDNDGLADPTPAVETFSLSNTAPIVQFTDPLAPTDTTYGSLTFSWSTIDPDGGGPGLHYRVWLDGNESSPDSTYAQTFTVPSHRFLQSGTFLSGQRRVFLQAVDDGGRSGPVVSFAWYVRAPAAVLDNNQARLLVIDDVPSSGTDGSNNFVFDGYYKTVADLLPAGTYSVLRPQFNPRIFRSGADVAQTFRQFRAVAWYRGGNLTLSTWLNAYGDSIAAYSERHGGNLYLEGLYLFQGVNAPGALPESFVMDHLRCERLWNCWNTVGDLQDSTACWGNKVGTLLRSSVYPEAPIRTVVAAPSINRTGGGLRGFVAQDTANVALWGMDGTLVPANAGYEVPVGMSIPGGSGGRLVVLSISPAYGGNTVTTRNFLRRVLNSFGIGVPLP